MLTEFAVFGVELALFLLHGQFRGGLFAVGLFGDAEEFVVVLDIAGEVIRGLTEIAEQLVQIRALGLQSVFDGLFQRRSERDTCGIEIAVVLLEHAVIDLA